MSARSFLSTSAREGGSCRTSLLHFSRVSASATALRLLQRRFCATSTPCSTTRPTERYRKLLRQDFARIPFPRERAGFLHLATLGAELIGLHLLADPRLLRPAVRLEGEPDPAPPGGYRLGSSRRRRHHLAFDEEKQRLDVNDEGLCFAGIRSEVYDYEVGGHRVLFRWLRLRTGRFLLPEEVTTFRRIATALDLTLAVQAKLAEAGTDLGEAS
jgi:Type ISP C-terminal specificity domain